MKVNIEFHIHKNNSLTFAYIIDGIGKVFKTFGIEWKYKTAADIEEFIKDKKIKGV